MESDVLDLCIVKLKSFTGIFKNKMIVLLQKHSLFELGIIGPELVFCNQSAIE